MFAEYSLHERLLKAVNKLGFEQPTEVQQQVIPAALSGKDLLASAETGSGKTAAYLLPLLQRMVAQDAPNSGTRALILLPTRELARQVLKHFSDLAGFTRIKAGLITGGVEFKFQRAELRKNPEVVIATPGRLLEHLSANSLDLADLEMLVLDEADRMLDMGFADDVMTIADACSSVRQTLLLSATLSPKRMGQVIDKVLRDPVRLLLSGARDQHAQIAQQIVLADDIKHKERLLRRLLEIEQPDKVVVFSNTRAGADKVGSLLRFHGYRAGVLHGDLTQDERNRIMQLMRQGGLQILVATDVAARGLDIKGVNLVINFDMARSGDEHVHRVGRTGRAGEEGLAISLISAREWNLMASVERYLRIKFERRDVPGLEGKYKGPEKLKASGKAVRSGKRKKPDPRKAKPVEKGKQRHRDRKQIGKRRTPATPVEQRLGDGFAPLKRKKTDDSEP
ncbi:DEAD/DEAH box helicase [Motiliproteus sediminis]|uniref:DEAD/DEAH box helicase n=1 Tax=Motiliproteus sediminis TaxID=1468178 RepID=UPI001AEF897F|nr:DEAD/DEAH box helicase [Motiliproteus sediminis]